MAHSRESLKAAFIEKSGWGNAEISFLAGDCSNRTYDRLTRPDKTTAVLMDAYGENEKIQSFVDISALLNRLGCSAPKVLSKDLENRFLLLEDFGDETFTMCLEKDINPDILYESATNALVHLHKNFDLTMSPSLPAYDPKTLLEQANVFLEWYFPSIHGKKASSLIVKEWEIAWHDAFRLIETAPKTIILRDFHVDNLVWLKDRNSIQQCGLLDFQDASIGPQVYDLVSLFEDVRQDVSPTLTKRLLKEYLSHFPLLDEESFMAQYYTVGAQRATRIIGVFSRMLLKQNRDHYMRFIPRTWKWLENDLKHDNLLAIRHWFDQYFPEEKRRAITCL
jgi:aminoglycoside/choline kinase family phosphotransferase